MPVPPNRADTFRFCSRRCGWRWHNKNNRVHKTCVQCTADFTVIACREKTARYCSRPCYYKAIAKRGTVEHTCDYCGETFWRSPSRTKSKYCSWACRIEGHKLGHEMPGAQSYRSWMRRRGRLAQCEACGYDAHPEILVVHHKDKNRRNNKPENLAVLCPNCHALAHYDAETGDLRQPKAQPA